MIFHKGVRSMTDSALSTPKRLLRNLIGGAILASAWVAVDLITHTDSASATEFPDVTASGSSLTPDVVAPVIAHVTSIAAQVSADPPSPVTQAEAAVEQAVTVILSAPAAVIGPVVETLVEPLEPVVAGVVGALPPLPQLSVLPSAVTVLSSGGTGVALASSTVPLVPTPVGGVPRDLPAVPTPPSGDVFGAVSAALSSASLAPPGSALTAHALSGGIPPSPTYGFDTTPD
jgi:hypothetical protein